MKRVYLFANNHLLDTHHIKSLDIKQDDICFVFNYMHHSFPILKSLGHKNIYAFLRYIDPQDRKHLYDEFLGGFEFLEEQHNFKKLITICGENSEYIEYIDIPHENIGYDLLEKLEISYPNGISVPTTGFLGYAYAKCLFPEHEIILVGFTGHLPDGNEYTGNRHDYKWEQNYYKQNNVKMIRLE
jgi:hypothetical protein